MQNEHCAILSTFINKSVVIKIFVSSIFEWPFIQVFTVQVSIAVKITLFIQMDFTVHDDRISMNFLHFMGTQLKNSKL